MTSFSSTTYSVMYQTIYNINVIVLRIETISQLRNSPLDCGVAHTKSSKIINIMCKADYFNN